MNLSFFDLALISAYLLLTLYVGLRQSKKISTMKDYAIASQSYATPVLVATIAATAIGGGSTMGFAGKVFELGIVFILITLGEPVYKILIAKFIAPRMRAFSGLISAGDMMRHLYGKKAQIVTGIAGLLFSIGFVGAQIRAIGQIFEYFLHIPEHWGILTGASIVVVYSAFGGIRSVTITDIIQFGVLIVAIPIICSVGLGHVGGFSALIEKIPETHLSVVNDDIIANIGTFLILAIPFLNPAITQRLLMSKNPKQISDSMYISALVEAPFIVVAGLIGLIALALSPDLKASESLPHLVNTILPIGLKGLAISGMLAVIMSTTDSFLNTSSVSFVNDVILPLKKKKISSKSTIRLAQYSTFVFGSIAIAAAMASESITDIIIYSLNFWGPIVTPPLLAGIFGYKLHQRSVLIGMALSLLSFIIIELFLKNLFSINSLIPCVFVNILGFSISQFFYRKTKPITQVDTCSQAYLIEILKDTSLKVKATLKKLSFQNIVLTSQNHVEIFGAQYLVFAVFCLINYILPYFMWSISSLQESNILLILRIVCGFLCFFLLMKDYWPKNLKKYLPLYWYFTLMCCLPFFNFLMLFVSHLSSFWIFATAISIFTLILLVDWTVVFTLLCIGGGSAVLLFGVIFGFERYTFVDRKLLFPALYMYAFTLLVGVVFSRNREKRMTERETDMKFLAGTIAHELRTPLSTLQLMTGQMRRVWDWSLNKLTPSDMKALQVSDIDYFKSIPNNFDVLTRNAQTSIDIILTNLKDKIDPTTFEPHSMKEVLKKALRDLNTENNIVIEGNEDFTFYGNDLLMQHVIYNLLKNALYAIQAKGSGSIKIFLQKDRDVNTLSIQDTGEGMDKETQRFLFQKFFTTKKTGTGLGLAFCKRVIGSFKGSISFVSEKGQGTTFKISLPKKNSKGIH